MKVTLAAVVLAVAAAPAALAATPFGASATLSGLRYSLIDLAPDDGIAPSFSFLAEDRSYIASIQFLGSEAMDSVYSDRHGPHGTYQTLTMRRGGAMGSAAVLSGATELPGLVSATGTTAPGRRFDAFEIGGEHNVALQLAPNTALQVDGYYSVSAWARQRAGASGAAGAKAYVTFGQAGYGVDARNVEAHADPGRGRSFAQDAGAFSFQFKNETDAARYVFGGVSAWVSGGQVTPAGEVSPIPEPSTYALMAAGLGFVGFAAKRRKAEAA